MRVVTLPAPDASDAWPPVLLTDRADLKPLVQPKKEQLELFAA